MDDDGLIPDAARGGARSEREARLPLHDPDLPEPERPDDPRGAPAPRSSSSPQAAGVTLLEDDPYGLIRFEGDGAAVAVRARAASRSIYTSSFSKTVAPGLRVGWYILPPRPRRARSTQRANSTYITPVLLGEAVVYEFIRRGSFEPNLQRVNELLQARAATRCSRRSTSTCPGARWSQPEGGYFIWLELPEGTNAKRGARARRRRHGRARHRLRRRREHDPARLQLRLARGDRRRASSGSPPPSASAPGRQASRGAGGLSGPRHELRLAAAARGSARRPGRSGKAARATSAQSPWRWK